MRYVFGDYEVDTQRNELRHGEIPCPLESQVFQVLVYLVQHRDRVVSKAELLEYLWPQQYISETTLSQRLMLVRKAIDDSGPQQRVITTVPGRGYRFVATVEEQTEIPPATACRCFGATSLPSQAEGRSDIMETLMSGSSLQCPSVSTPTRRGRNSAMPVRPRCSYFVPPVAREISLGRNSVTSVLHPSLVLHQTRTGPMCPSPTLPRT